MTGAMRTKITGMPPYVIKKLSCGRRLRFRYKFTALTSITKFRAFMTSLETRLGAARARLAGKTAIVTGAGSEAGEIGIGKAIALLFAREGAQVAVIDWQRDRAEQTCADIRDAGGDAIALAANVTDKSDCERAIAKTLERYCKLDILVNNVGIAGGAPGD